MRPTSLGSSWQRWTAAPWPIWPRPARRRSRQCATRAAGWTSKRAQPCRLLGPFPGGRARSFYPLEPAGVTAPARHLGRAGGAADSSTCCAALATAEGLHCRCKDIDSAARRLQTPFGSFMASELVAYLLLDCPSQVATTPCMVLGCKMCCS